ncbi:MAG: zinc ABC transporter substrate-binding protein [Roseburia sp.]|nr:zinc ABC transporter substrate-binding protein [Roseburia sp.]MBQ8518270.1 zinc ABC transporter substrate-binding protein [Agathobacter sp.]
MKNKYVFVLVMLLSILVVSFGFTNIYVSHNQPAEDEDFVVVTSFYPMYIATMNVIGDTEGVTLKNLSEPQTGCLHDFQLTPADMKVLSTADVFVINGGGIESFMEEIAEQYPDLVVIEACEGIELLCEEDAHGHVHEDSHSEEDHEDIHGTEEHDHENEDAHDEDVHNHDVNAHAWMSVELYRKQVETIASGLAKAAPQMRESFLANAGDYDRKLEALQVEQEKLLTLTKGEEVILFHCAYDYVAEDLGLETAFCMDLDEERQVSAGEVAEVLEVIEHHGVKYIFAEELYGTDMCEMVQKEVDVEVIYLNPLNRGEYEADSYIEGMRNNLKLIKEVFQ